MQLDNLFKILLGMSARLHEIACLNICALSFFQSVPKRLRPLKNLSCSASLQRPDAYFFSPFASAAIEAEAAESLDPVLSLLTEIGRSWGEL